MSLIDVTNNVLAFAMQQESCNLCSHFNVFGSTYRDYKYPATSTQFKALTEEGIIPTSNEAACGLQRI